MALETNVDPSYLYYEGYVQTTPGESSYTVAMDEMAREDYDAHMEQQAEMAYDRYMESRRWEHWSDYYDGPHY